MHIHGRYQHTQEDLVQFSFNQICLVKVCLWLSSSRSGKNMSTGVPPHSLDWLCVGNHSNIHRSFHIYYPFFPTLNLLELVNCLLQCHLFPLRSTEFNTLDETSLNAQLFVWSENECLLALLFYVVSRESK